MTALEVVGIVLLVLIGAAVAIWLILAFLEAVTSGWGH